MELITAAYTFGCDPNNIGSPSGRENNEYRVHAGKFTTGNYKGIVSKITAEIHDDQAANRDFQCGIFDTAGNIITNGTTETKTVLGNGGYQTVEFSYSSNLQPIISANTTYYIGCVSQSLAGAGSLAFTTDATATYGEGDYSAQPPIDVANTMADSTGQLFHIYATYNTISKTEITGPDLNPDGTEDYFTYEEADPDGGKISISSNHINVYEQDRRSIAYVRKYYGLNHFGNFTHTLKVSVPYSSAKGIETLAWGINSVESYKRYWDWIDNNDGLMLGMYSHNENQPRARLRDCVTVTSDESINLDNTPWWLTIKREGHTATCQIYSDAARTSLSDTLTIAPNNRLYSYLFQYATYGTATEKYSYMDVEDLDINEPHEITFMS